MNVRHPSLYEINTRILLNSLGPDAMLKDIPDSYWKELHGKGIDWIWLMGIWEIQEKALDPHVIPQNMMEEFRALMPELTDADISGSPYAIHDYQVDPAIGDEKQLKTLRSRLHKLGMKLMLDFVPNHFGAHTKWLDTHPEYFIEVAEAYFLKDRKTFYRPWDDRNRFFAHGKDPYFEAWQDTVQVNYASPAVQEWMTGMLQGIAGLCDGVRCDMAMLPVNRIFRQTWGHAVTVDHDSEEFWPSAIATVTRDHPEFVFLAECYWDMEAELMRMGFHYCYDKVFYDRITVEDRNRMRQHFHAEPWWLNRTARFLENHDEHRATARLFLENHMAAAALVALGPGMRFWHMGQWEGRRKKIPVQINRNPDEAKCGCLIQMDQRTKASKEQKERPHCMCIKSLYEILLELNQERIFREGDWRVVHEHQAEHGLICWLWQLKEEHALVVINYSEKEAVFSLNDQLHLLHLKEPKDMIDGNQSVNAHSVQSLAPWGVYLWKVNK